MYTATPNISILSTNSYTCYGIDFHKSLTSNEPLGFLQMARHMLDTGHPPKNLNTQGTDYAPAEIDLSLEYASYSLEGNTWSLVPACYLFGAEYSDADLKCEHCSAGRDIYANFHSAPNQDERQLQ
jgi:hypothetical protein